MAGINVHLLQPGEIPGQFHKFCPTRGNAITTTADHTDLLPNGDGFDWVVYDSAHHLIFYRDVCPIDPIVTLAVQSLPTLTSQSIASFPGLSGYALVDAVWLDLFARMNAWLVANVADQNIRSYVQNVILPKLLLNWMVSQQYITLMTLATRNYSGRMVV